MTVRTSQKIVASSFIVGTTSIFVLFAHIKWTSGSAPDLSLTTAIGTLGWIVMLSACLVVILHPKPEKTFLGRFAFQKEPLLHEAAPTRKRMAALVVVVIFAVLSVTVTILAVTGALNMLFEKYVF